MKHVVFVVEGQTEQLFLMKFIERLATLKQYHIQLSKFHNRRIMEMGVRGFPVDQASHLIQIINVENDDKVLSYIEENLKAFITKGVVAVYGLRDRYTGDKRKTQINPEAVDRRTAFLEAEHSIDIEVTIAVEEIEAWFLSIPSFFAKFNEILTLEKINEVLGFDLANTQIELIEHPANVIDKVLQSVQLQYKKKLHDSHAITEKIDYETLYLEKSLTINALNRTVKHLNAAIS
jgi:hypothetical protein